MIDTPRTDEARNYRADVTARNARLIDLAETLERENKDLHDEIFRLNEWIDLQNATVLRLKRETDEMSRRAIQAEDELAKVKDDFDKAIEQRDKWRDEADELDRRIGRIMKEGL